MVDSCEPYWKFQCIRSGLFQDLDLLQREVSKFGSFKELLTSLIKFKTCFKPDTLTLKQSKLCNKDCNPIGNGFYYSCPSTVNASISVFKLPSTTSVKRTMSYSVENVFPHGYPSVVWSSSSDSGVLLCTNNGHWLRYCFPTDGCTSPSAHSWEEEHVRSFVYHVAGCCPSCCLVVIMSKRRNSESLWELEALQLRKGHHNVSSVSTKFHFYPSELDAWLEDRESLDPFRVHSVNLSQSFSDSCVRECDGRLTKHRLLVQFGYAMVMFELSTSESQCSLSAPLTTWCPSHQSQDFLYPYSSECLLSKDRAVIALCKSNDTREINVWHPSDEKESRVAIPSRPRKATSHQFTKCLAIGRLFTVVAKCLGDCLPVLYVMSTDSGGLFCECDLNSIKSSLLTKVTSCYFQMTVIREVTQQHKELLDMLELGNQREWLDSLMHTGVRDLCRIPCMSSHESSVMSVICR